MSNPIVEPACDYTQRMEIHRRLAERLTAMLGEPDRRGTQHTWEVRVGLRTVNVVLDLPDPLEHVRLWIFDPRRGGMDCVRSFPVKNEAQVADVLAEVQAIPAPPPIGVH